MNENYTSMHAVQITWMCNLKKFTSSQPKWWELSFPEDCKYGYVAEHGLCAITYFYSVKDPSRMLHYMMIIGLVRIDNVPFLDLDLDFDHVHNVDHDLLGRAVLFSCPLPPAFISSNLRPQVPRDQSPDFLKVICFVKAEKCAKSTIKI